MRNNNNKITLGYIVIEINLEQNRKLFCFYFIKDFILLLQSTLENYCRLNRYEKCNRQKIRIYCFKYILFAIIQFLNTNFLGVGQFIDSRFIDRPFYRQPVYRQTVSSK
jgi:hypothetical protein